MSRIYSLRPRNKLETAVYNSFTTFSIDSKGRLVVKGEWSKIQQALRSASRKAKPTRKE